MYMCVYIYIVYVLNYSIYTLFLYYTIRILLFYLFWKFGIFQNKKLEENHFVDFHF